MDLLVVHMETVAVLNYIVHVISLGEVLLLMERL